MAPLQKLFEEIDRQTGIKGIVMTTCDGRMIEQRGTGGKDLGTYIAYAALTAEQIKPHLGFNGPYHLIMEPSTAGRLVIVPGKQVIIGLELDMLTSPATVLDKIGPLVAQLND